jgi:DNA polymerase-1
VKLFYDVMRLPVVKRTGKGKGKNKGQPSTDRESVAIWTRAHPEHKEFLQALQNYAELCKFQSTYVTGILRNTVNGRVHPSYNSCGAKTGRTSSKQPNFQNLPSRGDTRKMLLVKRIKKMIAAPEGYVLLGADEASIEMRWAAIISKDPKLVECFQGDGLIHERVCKELFDYVDCPLSEVKKKYEFERNSVSKKVQFLAIYGGGADALARNVNDSVNERREMAEAKGEECDLKEFTKEHAQEILDRYFQQYSGLSRYIAVMTRFIMEHGYAPSHYGYKRRVPAVNSTDPGVVAEAVRQAINATFQNPASVALLLALCNLQDEIDEMVASGMILETDWLQTGSIHDAGYGQIKRELILLGRDRLVHHLEAPPFPGCEIPLSADAEYGINMAEFSDDFGNALEKEDDEAEEEDAEEISEVEEAA